MHVLEDEETGDQPGRQRRLAGACRADHGEASFQKAPVDLLRQPDQRVTHIDDPLQGRPEQILLPLIARLRHRFPRAISARSGNHDPPQIGIANCKKTEPRSAFPANSITRSNELVFLSQRYPDSSHGVIADGCSAWMHEVRVGSASGFTMGRRSAVKQYVRLDEDHLWISEDGLPMTFTGIRL